MKGRQIILDHINDREAAALMVDGKLDDLLIDSDHPRPGCILRAVADRPMKGQGGVVLKGPDGPVFLRQIKGLSPGDVLTVQISGHAEPGKAVPVTTRLLFKSRFAIVTPGAPGVNISRRIRDDDLRDELLGITQGIQLPENAGLILRSSCAEADPEDIADDIEEMAALCGNVLADKGTGAEVLVDGPSPHETAWNEWSEAADVYTEAGGFEDLGVMDQIDSILGAEVRLSGGAKAFVEPTRAAIAVDVNTGADTSPAAGTKANMALAKTLPRQLRLRGLGGQVFLDLAPMPKKERRGFESALRAAFKTDAIETILAGWTPLGNYELQRKRARIPLQELLK